MEKINKIKSSFRGNSRKLIITVLIFIVFITLRTWILPQTIPFGWDQQRDAQITQKIISQFSIPLIGPRVVGDNGFYLGPYFFYILTPFYFLTSLHPYAIVVFTITYSIIFFIITFYTLNKIYGFKIASIFLFIWGALPICINIDRVAWNPLLIPLGFSVLLLFLHNYQNSWRYYLIIGIFLGLAFHIHFQAIFYSVFAVIFLLNKNIKIFPKLIWILLGFILTFIPLLVFDIRHQWLNVHLFLNFFFSTQQSVHSIASYLPVWTNYIGQITSINNIFFSIATWFILIVFGLKKHRQPIILSSACLLLITPIAFALYGKRPSEYYFIYLLPIIILFTSITLSKIRTNYYFAILIILIIPFISIKSIKISPTSLFYKDEIVKKAKTIIKDSSVYVTYDTPLGENNGFDYLINYYKINKSADTTRPGVQFIIPKRENLPTFGDISLFIPDKI